MKNVCSPDVVLFFLQAVLLFQKGALLDSLANPATAADLIPLGLLICQETQPKFFSVVASWLEAAAFCDTAITIHEHATSLLFSRLFIQRLCLAALCYSRRLEDRGKNARHDVALSVGQLRSSPDFPVKWDSINRAIPVANQFGAQASRS